MSFTLEIGRFVDPDYEIEPRRNESSRAADLSEVGTFRDPSVTRFLAGVRVEDVYSDTEFYEWLKGILRVRLNDMKPDQPIPVDIAALAADAVVTATWTHKRPTIVGFKQTPSEGLFLPAGFLGGMKSTPRRQFSVANSTGCEPGSAVGMLPLEVRGFSPLPNIPRANLPGRMPHIILGSVFARIIEIKR